MNCFDTLDEMWLDAAQELLNTGQGTESRDGGVFKEILGYSARINNPRACFLLNPVRCASVSYAGAELLWYLSMTDDTTLMQAYAPQYARFTEDGTLAYGAYGHRWANDPGFRAGVATNGIVPSWEPKHSPISQLDYLVATLSAKPDSRQAIMSMWVPRDLTHALAGDRKDLPCTLSLQFLVREGKLNLICTMRSNDIWLGMPYDVFCFASIQQIVADSLRIELGWYQHQAGSLHVYQRNEEKFKLACAPPSFSVGGLENNSPSNLDMIQVALACEQFNRENKAATDLPGELQHTLLGQAVLMAATKWSKQVQLDSKLLQRYLED